MTQDQASFLSDEEFIKQASHLLIQKELKNISISKNWSAL